MINAGVIGYSIGAVVFLILTFLLAVSARVGLQERSILLASFVSFVWSVFAGVQASTEQLNNIYLSLLELLRDGSWLLFLFVLLSDTRFSGRLKTLLLMSSKFVLPVLVFLSIYMFLSEVGIFPDISLLNFTGLVLVKFIVVAIGLAFIVQLLRGPYPENRLEYNFLFIGIGCIFAYDFYLYADALFANNISIDAWMARGYVNALAVPLIALSIVRNKNWSLDIFVSKDFIFYSVVFTGISLYLLLMAAGGYYIRIYGGDWGGVAQVAFFFGAGPVLFIWVFSGRMRARLRIFLAKKFQNYKYDYREEWLRVIRLLSTKQAKQELRTNAIRVLADIVESTEAGLWVKNDAGQYQAVAAWNLENLEACSEYDASSMPRFLRQWQWVIDLNEYVEAPDLYKDLELPDWINDKKEFWLIVPLMLQTELYGFVILGRARVPISIGWEERDLLLTTGRQITSFFALMDMDEALAETRQFEAFNRLSAYVVHDLKNLVAQLSLIVSNADKHKGNPAFMEDALDTVENAVEKMNKMLAQLRKGHTEYSDNVRKENFSLDDLLREVVNNRGNDNPKPVLVLVREGINVQADRERVGAVLEHMIQNAQEATPDNGKVELRLEGSEQEAVIEITDTGCGMDQQFIQERLFRPFDTTKGNAGMGIGVYESREVIYSHGGSLTVESQPGQGTTFRITLSITNETEISDTAKLQGDAV